VDEEVNKIGLPGLLATIPTKKTPVLAVNFTRRNLLLAAGPYRRGFEKKDTKN